MHTDRRTLAAGTVLCRSQDIAEGQARGFGPEAASPAKVIVVRRGGRLHGWLDSCPHYFGGTPMAWRRDEYLDGTGEYLACHAHGALFDIESGECLAGPCLGKALVAVPLEVDGAGRVVLKQAIQWGSIAA